MRSFRSVAALVFAAVVAISVSACGGQPSVDADGTWNFSTSGLSSDSGEGALIDIMRSDVDVSSIVVSGDEYAIEGPNGATIASGKWDSRRITVNGGDVSVTVDGKTMRLEDVGGGFMSFTRQEPMSGSSEEQTAKPPNEDSDVSSVSPAAINVDMNSEDVHWSGTVLVGSAVHGDSSVEATFWAAENSAPMTCSWSTSALGVEDDGAVLAKDRVIQLADVIGDAGGVPYLVLGVHTPAQGLAAERYETTVRPIQLSPDKGSEFTTPECLLGQAKIIGGENFRVSDLVAAKHGVAAYVAPAQTRGEGIKTVGVELETGEIAWSVPGEGEAPNNSDPLSRYVPDYFRVFVPNPAHEDDIYLPEEMTQAVDAATGQTASAPGKSQAYRFDEDTFLLVGFNSTDIATVAGETKSIGNRGLRGLGMENTTTGTLLAETQLSVETADGHRVFVSYNSSLNPESSLFSPEFDRGLLYIDAAGTVSSVFTPAQNRELDPFIVNTSGADIYVTVRGDVSAVVDLEGKEVTPRYPDYWDMGRRTIGNKTWVLWADSQGVSPAWVVAEDGASPLEVAGRADDDDTSSANVAAAGNASWADLDGKWVSSDPKFDEWYEFSEEGTFAVMSKQAFGKSPGVGEVEFVGFEGECLTGWLTEVGSPVGGGMIVYCPAGTEPSGTFEGLFLNDSPTEDRWWIGQDQSPSAVWFREG